MTSNYLSKSAFKIRVLAFAFTLAFCGLMVLNATAQMAYTRSTFTGSYTAVSGGALTITGGDDITNSIPLPFNFTYNGTNFTTSNFLAVCSNGWAAFSTTSITTPVTASNLALYTTTTPQNTLAPWWDDMNTSAVGTNPAGSMKYETTGSAGNQVLTIQWVVSSYYTNTIGQPKLLNFQIKLYETTNVIEFWYGAATGTAIGGSSSTAQESASIGIEDATGGIGHYLDAVTGSAFTGNGYLTSWQWPAYNFRFTPGSPTAIAAGTYNVGVGQTYPSLSEAVANLNHKGVSGPVTLNLTDATYDSSAANGSNFFPVLIGPVSGASAGNTITVTKSGTAAIVRWGGATGASGNLINQASTTALTSSVDPIIALVGADYVTLNNLDIRGNINYALSDHALGVYNSSATDGATNNTFTNIAATMNRGNTGSCGIRQQVITTPSSAAGANSTNIYKNLTIKSVYVGIWFTGNASFPDLNCEIGTTACNTFNIIGDPATANDIGNGTTVTYGIRATNQSGVKIYNNSVRNVTASAAAPDGIFLELFQGTSSVYHNKVQTVKNSSTSSTTSISGIAASHATTGTHVARIYDNTVSEIISSYTGAATATRTLKGIFIRGTGGSTAESYEIWNNSVSMNASASPNLSSVCFEHSTASGPVYIIRNNIFANFTPAQGATAKHYCIATTSATTIGNTGTVCNNNDYWIASDQGTSGAIGIGSSTNYFTLANWQAGITSPAGTDAASINVDPGFTNSTSDLHASAVSINNAGTAPAAYVTDDLDCIARTDNDMGAYNITVNNDDAGVTAIVLPSPMCAGLQTVQATIKNYGAVTLNSVTVNWSVTPGGAQTPVSPAISLASGASTTITLGTFTFAGGTTYSITANTSLPNGNTDGNTLNDAFTQGSVIAGITSGTFTVGVGGNYTTLTNAVAAYNQGCITGPIVFNLIDATYPSETFPISINAVAGANATNTLTIKPNTTATISGSVASGALIRLNGANWVTIDGSNSGGTDQSLTITNTSTTSPTAVSLVSLGAGLGASNNTIKNCLISTGVFAGADYGIAIGGSTPGSSGADNDNVTIQNNTITIATFGIYAVGTAALSAGGLDNLSIIGNSITTNTTVATYGMQLGGALNSSVSQNSISVLTTAASAPVGISLETNFVSSSVTRNNITNVSTTNTGGYGGRGIAIGTGTATSNLTIANNFISGVNGPSWTSFSNSASMGIAIGMIGNSTTITTTAGGINIYYNSVNMYGTYPNGGYAGSSVTAALYVGSGASALDVRNNILVNSENNPNVSGTASKNYAIYSAAANTAFTSINYNDYYVSGAQGVLGNIGATDRTNLAGIIAGFGQNAQSQNIAPVFTSNSDLHLNVNNNPSLDGAGTTVAVTIDYDGTTRSGTPDIGADEFSPPSCISAVGGNASGSNSFCGSGTPTITNSGFSTGTGSTYQWYSSSNIGDYPNAGSAVGGQTNPATLTTGVVNTTTYYWLRVTCATNSSTDNSTMVTITVNPSAASISPSTATICNGQSITLTENGGTGTSWSWAPGGATTQAITVNPSVNTTYTVTVTSPGPCTATATRTVTVNPAPVINGVSATPSAVCPNGSTNLTAAVSVNVTNASYCSPTITSNPGATGDYMNNFTFANITNNTSGDAASDYTYYSALTANVVANGTTPYNISCGAGGTSSTYGQQFRIWIDFNHSGTFDASESVFNTTTYTWVGGTGANAAPATGSVTIPVTAYNGVTRMRVLSNYGTTVSTNTAGCTYAGYGEYEDYNVSITGGLNNPSITYLWSESPASGTLTSTSTNPTSATNITVGETYTVDATFNGCTATANTSVTVNTTPVIAACPSDITTCNSVVTYSTPTATGTPAPTVSCSPASGSTFSTGSTTVTCTATNSCGSSTCTFSVTVNESPVIGSCPSDITTCNPVVTYSTPTATGTPAPTVSCSPASGSTFSTGATTVTCTATNSCGSSTCTFSVTVNESPVIGACPSDITTCNAVVTYSTPSATGTPTPTVSCSPASGSTFSLGTTTVTCTATNGCSPDATCTFSVTVNTASTDPTSATSNAAYNQICLGGSVTLTVNGGSLGTGATWVWYDGGCGLGTPVGTGPSITLTPATNGAHQYCVRAESAGCGNTACQCVTVNVISAPPTNTIQVTAAPTDGCVSAPAQTMSTNAVAGVTFYRWTSAQAGVRFNGNPGPFETTVPTVNITFVSLPAAGASGWSICVFAGNACGNTNTICSWVRATVSMPSPIVGSIVGCPGSSGNAYSVSSVAGAASYQWSATGGMVITGNGSQNITVSFPGGFTTGVLSVHGQTACGYNGPNRNLTISSTPATPGTISGPSYPCPNASATYSIAAVPGAVSYTWSTSVVGAVVTGTTTSCSILFPASIPPGSTVSVVANSSCPTSSGIRSKGIATGVPATPGSVTGPSSGQCGQTGVSYSVSPVALASSYSWTASCGTIVGPTNLSAVTVDWPASFTSCTLYVTATNSCGTSGIRTQVVTAAPATPAVITGNAAPCVNAVESYSTAGSAGATSYIWTVPSGATILGPSNGNSIIVQWGSTSGSITVRGSNTCGNSAVRSLACTISCRMSQVNGTSFNAEVYPNPANENATVKFTSQVNGSYHLEMTDVTGRSVYSQEGAVSEGQNLIDLDLANVAKGVYLLNLSSGDSSSQIRVVVE